MLDIAHHSSVHRRGCQPPRRRLRFNGRRSQEQEVGVRRVLVSIGVIVAASMVTPLAATASTISQTKLTSELLVKSQMPAGWTVSFTTSEGVGCVHDLLEPKG